MNRFLSILCFILTTNILFAQTDNYKIAIKKFKTDYNTENTEELFNSFAPVMQERLPLLKIKEFVTSLKKQYGQIETVDFIEYQSNTSAIYKAKFEKEMLTITLSLDADNKINGLFFSPHNSTINALGSYPKETGEAIFSRLKRVPDRTQLSIAVIQDGKTDYYGVIKENDTIKPIENQEKVFEIGSVTKVFTSTILASLVEDKKIELTDTVNNFYPFAFKDNIKLTFKNLANHSSGLPRMPSNYDISNVDNPYKRYGKTELEIYLKDSLKIDNEASTVYAYSNLGTGILGYTLGLSQKNSFQNLLQELVFNKYNMKNSYVLLKDVKGELVKGQNPNGEDCINWEFDVLFPAGGIFSTSSDLAKFALAQFNPQYKELALTRNPTFKINDNMQIGLGWHIIKSEHGNDIIWHNGGTGGYSSSITVNTENKTAVVILSNLSTFHRDKASIDNIAFDIIDQLKM